MPPTARSDAERANGSGVGARTDAPRGSSRALGRALALALALATAWAMAVPAAAHAPAGPGAAGVPALAPASPEAPPPPGKALLPDLVQVTPYQLSVERVRTRRGTRHRLGFASAVTNAGDGQLVVRARRTRQQATMSADQIVRLRDGGHVRRPRIGALRYVRSGGHEHWHYMGFDRYELRDVATGALVAPDRKSGFCLGDRYDETLTQGRPRLPRADRFLGLCGIRRPEATSMVQGISPGYGDEYLPHLEGQYVDVTRLPPGPYVLVHRVNADRSLLERDHANNASSVRIRLAIDPRGRRRVRVTARCPGTDTCPPAPRASAAAPG